MLLETIWCMIMEKLCLRYLFYKVHELDHSFLPVHQNAGYGEEFWSIIIIIIIIKICLPINANPILVTMKN